MVVCVNEMILQTAASATSRGPSRQRSLSMPAARSVNLLVREGCGRSPHVAIPPHVVQQRVQSEHAALQVRSCMLGEQFEGILRKAQQMRTIPRFPSAPVVTQPANLLSRRQRNRCQLCGCDVRGEPAVVFNKKRQTLLRFRVRGIAPLCLKMHAAKTE